MGITKKTGDQIAGPSPLFALERLSLHFEHAAAKVHEQFPSDDADFAHAR